MGKFLIFFCMISFPLLGQGKKASKHYKRGVKAVEANKYVQAVVDFTKAISFDKEYTDAYEQRGFSFLQLNRLEASAKDYEKVVALDPQRISSIAQLIAIYQYLEIPEEAFQAIDILEKYHAYADATILYERAECYELLEQNDNAFEHYKVALELFRSKGEDYAGLVKDCEQRIKKLEAKE